MRLRFICLPLVLVAVTIAGLPTAQAGSLTYSHTSSALPNAAGPAITLLSITGDNNGTDYTFTLTFANPTIEGPSSGNADAVYGFINMDTDNNAATGVTGDIPRRERLRAGIRPVHAQLSGDRCGHQLEQRGGWQSWRPRAGQRRRG